MKSKFFIGLAILISLQGCSSHHNSAPSQQTQQNIHQNLQNNRIPSPDEVASNSVPVADSACQKFRATIPSDWQQGFLTVPEDPNNPNGTQIHIFYYGKINPNSVPTIYFNGGPTDDSHGDFSTLTRRQPIFDSAKKISFIFLEQRGNGCSDYYPQGYDPATLQRLTYYGTRGIVADAEAVRAALWPGKPWIAAGQSYGGFITHRYVTLHPEALKSAFSEQDVITSDGYFRLKTRIESQNRVMSVYLTQYPDDVKRLEDLHAFLTPTQCFKSSDGTEKACGLRVLSPLVDSLLGFSDQWVTIHEWIGVMDHLDTGISQDGIARFLATFYFGASNPLNVKAWAGAVIDWVDRNVPPIDAEHCEKIQADLAANGINLSQVLLNECMTALQNAVANPTDSSLWLQKMPQDLLTIIYVPKEEFAEELTAIGTFANVHYTDFVGTGHDASYDEPSAWDDWINQSTQ
jgi:pimeloyl-ACP methyl ester carboxylesterase